MPVYGPKEETQAAYWVRIKKESIEQWQIYRHGPKKLQTTAYNSKMAKKFVDPNLYANDDESQVMAQSESEIDDVESEIDDVESEIDDVESENASESEIDESHKQKTLDYLGLTDTTITEDHTL